jgi:hypothetical protein
MAGIAIFSVFVLIGSFMKNDIGFLVCRALCGRGASMINASNAGEIHPKFIHPVHPLTGLNDQRRAVSFSQASS